MSRELKFRAWDGKQMHQPVDILRGQAIKPGHTATFWSDEAKAGVAMQSTGKLDSSRKEIFESDIIECEYYPDLPTTKGIDLVWRGVVRWGADASFHTIRVDGGGCYSVGYGGSAVKRWEVIGNIHEHPELVS